ncbi:pseudouridine synthase [Catenaria anguillulae PL171]|uniref:Pseudouridine synthase n=1 Tax=Catenaria anguillulae PL171 TaxID=765915 RepID=A0A1Y2HM25_9FUNG|nr:pseudouridine synthase [Catenaria anguillulae PL171]
MDATQINTCSTSDPAQPVPPSMASMASVPCNASTTLAPITANSDSLAPSAPLTPSISPALVYPLVKAGPLPIASHSFSFRKPNWPATTPDLDRTIDVLYHDAHFFIISKPHNFLIDGDEWSVQEFLQRTYPQYPLFHLIHQIDYATSGIMVLGLEKKATGRAGNLFQERWVRKEYVAVVRGWIEQDEVRVKSLIGYEEGHEIRMSVTEDPTKGKHAESIIHVRRRGYLHPPASSGLLSSTSETIEPGTFDSIPVTLVHLNLLTGRRHQLRIHLASIGHPIVGDPLYEATPPAGTIPQDAWPWTSSCNPDHPTQPRMLLHSHYILLPLHRGRTRSTGRFFDFDLAVRSPAPFVDWVGCRSCHEAPAAHKGPCSEADGCDVQGVACGNIDQWEREQRELAERDAVEDEANRIRKEKELRVRRERREKRRAEVMEMLAKEGKVVTTAETTGDGKATVNH